MKTLYLTRDCGADIRAVKVCNSLVKLGHQVVYAGWDRTPDNLQELRLVKEVKLRILRRPGVVSQNSWQGWGKYYRHVLRCLVEERPDVVQTSNEQSAAMVLPFKHVLYDRLIVDVIANSYRARWLDTAAQVCRWVVNAGADCLIETGPELQARRGRFVRKSIIIEDAPNDPGPEPAARVPTSGPIRLSLAGDLNNHRMDLSTLVRALDLMPQGSVVVQASGWLSDDYARNVFSRHPAVRYQRLPNPAGCLKRRGCALWESVCWYRRLPNPAECLNLAGTCDALLYLRSNAYRAAVRPNRIFDALAVGRPIIINPELAMAQWVERDRLGMVLRRFDPPSIVAAVQALAARRSALPQEAARLRRVFLDGHTWPIMEQRLGALYARYQSAKAASRPEARLICGQANMGRDGALKA
jgi:hypothetical protein